MNENKQEFSRDNLSGMDKIFVPKDLDRNLDLSDFLSYKRFNLKFWRTVPENCRLVTENIFGRTIKSPKGYGFKLVLPIFTRTILVPGEQLEGIKTFKDVKCLSKDKIELGVDLTLSMKITDPVKYVNKGKHQLEQLSSIVNRLLRIYVANKNFEEMVVAECDIGKFENNGELKRFTEENGISVNRVIFEKIELPERLKKLYNDAAEEEQKKRAQAVRLKAEEEKVKAEARMASIKADVEAERITKLNKAENNAYINKLEELMDAMQRKGISNQEIENYINTMIMAEKGNAIFMGGNSRSNDIAMGVAAGNKYSNRVNNAPNNSIYKNSNIEPETNYDLLLSNLFKDFLQGKISYQSLTEFKDKINGDAIKNYINKLDRNSSEYKDLVSQIYLICNNENDKSNLNTGKISRK